MKQKDFKAQFEKIRKLADQQETLTALEEMLLNFCELLLEINAEQAAEIQALKNEMNVLKGEQGQPKIRKQTNGQKKNHSSEDNRKNGKKPKSGKKKGSKKAQAKPDNTVKLEMNPDDLPVDAVKDGVKKTLIQDIQITTNNTLFVRQMYYSNAENKYYLTPLPVGYEGEYGPSIKSWSNVLYSANEMTTENITQLFNTAGVLISKPTVSSFIVSQGKSMETEKIAIAKAGLQSTSYQHLDDTAGRESGKNCHVNVLGNELFSAYFTLAHKDRLSIIEMLCLGDFKFSINPTAFALMETMNVPTSIIDAFKKHTTLKFFTQARIEEIIDGVVNGKKQTKLRKLLLEATAIAAYRQSPYAIKQLIVDDAPQFKLITEALGLCWVHEGRHYKKLNPLFKKHKKATDDFIEQFWEYYRKLVAYKKEPTSKLATELRTEFETLFSTKTGYEKLDKQIKITSKKIESLLLVLRYPFIPLHNNPAENMARRQARTRDIHLHTMSNDGTIAKDALATVVGTAKKLSVNIFDYIFDRITKKFEMISLAELITLKTAQLNST